MPDEATSPTPADDAPGRAGRVAGAWKRAAPLAVAALVPALLFCPARRSRGAAFGTRTSSTSPTCRGASRSTSTTRDQPALDGRGQLAPAPQRPWAPSAAVLVDRPRLQALRLDTNGPAACRSRSGACSACSRRTRSWRVSSTAARAPTRRSRSRRCRSTSCRRVRCSATSARWRAWRWRSAAWRSRRSTVTEEGPTVARQAHCRGSFMAAVGLFVGYESRGGLLGLARAAARRRPGVGSRAAGRQSSHEGWHR